MENNELQNAELPQNEGNGAQAEETTKPLIGEVTAEQIAAWKAKYGKIFKAVVDGHMGYLRPPNRNEVAYATQMQNNPIRSNEYILKSCWLGGSMVIQTDDALFFGIQGQLGRLVQVKAGEVSEL